VLDKKLKSNKNKMFINVGFTKEEIVKNKQEVSYEILGRHDYNWMNIYKLCVKYENFYDKNITQILEYENIRIGGWLNKQQQRSY